MKKVEIRGLTFEVPDEYKYLAVDAGGSVCAFTHPPILEEGVYLPTEGQMLTLTTMEHTPEIKEI